MKNHKSKPYWVSQNEDRWLTYTLARIRYARKRLDCINYVFSSIKNSNETFGFRFKGQNRRDEPNNGKKVEVGWFNRLSIYCHLLSYFIIKCIEFLIDFRLSERKPYIKSPL